MLPKKTIQNRLFQSIICLTVVVGLSLTAASGVRAWQVDRERFHASVHGTLACSECHDVEIGPDHPKAARVRLSMKDIHSPDSCLACHEEVMDILKEEHRHGSKTEVNPERYSKSCLGCHHPHNQPALHDKPGVYDPNAPKEKRCSACHEAKTDLPELDEEAAACLGCHAIPLGENKAAREGVEAVCYTCHAKGAEHADKTTPLLDKAAMASGAHAEVSCLSCHPRAMAYQHGDQPPGQCLNCHHRHRGEMADPHANVACQACHLDGVKPVKDDLTGRVGWKIEDQGGKVSRIHDMTWIKTDPEKSCRRCHATGNQVGAAAAVLPAKGLICLPCHTASFSVTDTVNIVTLIGFIIGLLALASVWSGGAGGAGIGAMIGSAFRAVFSAKFGRIASAFILDGLFQRRLYRASVGRWFIHALIFMPFLFRFIWGLIGLIGVELAPGAGWVWDLVDKNSAAAAFWFDFSGLCVVIGVGLAIARRALQNKLRREARPELALPKPDWPAYALLGGLIVVGFIVEGVRIAMTGFPPGADFAFIGVALANMFKGASGLTGLYPYLWYLHAALWGVFVVYLPFSKMSHIVFGPLNAAVKAAGDEHHHHGAGE